VKWEEAAMRGLVGASVVGLCLAFQWPNPGLAQPQPQVSPDRTEDVADAGDNPFLTFDDFSWRAFIALNWPALTGAANRGLPDRSKKFGDPGPRVWETWKARYEVFAPGGAKPAAWNSYDGSNPCGGFGNKTKMLSAFTHFADFNQASFTLGRLANPLVAQNRTYTRYEVRFNKEEFDTIDQNQWYIRSKLPTAANPGKFRIGSIEVKAAWRILNDRDTAEVRRRYYVTKALVFDPDATDQAGSIVCNMQDVALVGLHIVSKTRLRPQWIWTSFEHVDNVPPRGDGDAREPDAKDSRVPYSYNSGMPPAGLAPKRAPPSITQNNHPPNPDPMQVVRMERIKGETMQRNRAYWALPEIRGTIWENYMLVMTQWPKTPGQPNGDPFPIVGPTNPPTNLANTTMETYLQGPGASCMQCHQSVSNRHGMDFVAFMLLDAHDPLQAAMARSVPLERTTIASGKKAARRPDLRKTALDDHPSISALARILRQGSGR
jgi:hypothetical protein